MSVDELYSGDHLGDIYGFFRSLVSFVQRLSELSVLSARICHSFIVRSDCRGFGGGRDSCAFGQGIYGDYFFGFMRPAVPRYSQYGKRNVVKLEDSQLVPRGADYIEGIAKVFEARNYLVMMVALVTTGGIIFLEVRAGVFLGILAIIASHILMSGQKIGEIAEVREGRVSFDGPLLMVDDIVIMNVGEKKARTKILSEGVGLILTGKDDNGRAALNNLGQRQAILHDIAAIIGSKAEICEPSYTPMARKNVDTGAIGIYFLPNERDVEGLIKAVKRTPLLESAVSKKNSVKRSIG